MDEQLSLFGDETDIAAHQNETGSGKLTVTQLAFVEGTEMTWKELFSGFDSLYAITYSSGLGFVTELVNLFENAEIIFGCEQVMSYTLSEIMAFQAKLMEKIRSGKKSATLLERIGNKTLRLYVARQKTSHEKIYLLSSKDGRRRVITGSANMSATAFTGVQRENIAFIDGDAAYDWYMDYYTQFRNECTDNISEKAVLVADDGENLEELPVAKTAAANKVLVIAPDKSVGEEVSFALSVRGLAAKYKAVPVKAEKNGTILLNPTLITQLKRHFMDIKDKEKKKRQVYPQLVLDVTEGTAALNDTKLDLNPAEEEIRRDVDLFISYMKGFEDFHGDVQYMQSRYMAVANWFFCSPFMSVMRNTAKRNNLSVAPYPLYGLVYGKSKAGKTEFLKTLQKMMIGQIVPPINTDNFTFTNLNGLLHEVKGVPVICDDIPKDKFDNHGNKLIKRDDFGYDEGLENYPAIVISANEELKVISPQISRRMVICGVYASMTTTEIMLSTFTKRIQDNIGTALFREYLRRMFEKVPAMLESMIRDDAALSDILNTSSEVLCEIISQYASSPDIPSYIRPMSLESDYFSSKEMGAQAIKTITTAWRTSPGSFTINKKQNELRYNVGEQQQFEAERILKELPETLEAQRSRTFIIMKLDAAKEYFGIDFKKGFFWNR